MKPIKKINKTLRAEIDALLPKVKDEKITILYLDDEVQNLRAFKSVFRRSKFNILTSLNVEESLALLKTNKVHIFFTDYCMPNLNGDEVLKMVLPFYPNLIPIVLSGYLTFDIKKIFKDSFKNITLIEKPFNSSEVAILINRSYNTKLATPS